MFNLILLLGLWFSPFQQKHKYHHNHSNRYYATRLIETKKDNKVFVKKVKHAWQR